MYLVQFVYTDCTLYSDDDFRSGCRNVSHHYTHPDDQTTLLHVTPGFKPFTEVFFLRKGVREQRNGCLGKKACDCDFGKGELAMDPPGGGSFCPVSRLDWNMECWILWRD